MKNQIKTSVFVLGLLLLSCQFSYAQTQKLRLAVLGIESKNVNVSGQDITDLVRYEIEKSQRYDVMNHHDVKLLLSRAGDELDNIYSQTLLVERGKVIGADKMLTGSVMRFSDKIIVSLKIINVETGATDRANVVEYIDAENELRSMVQLSVKRLLNLDIDEQRFEELTKYESELDLGGIQNQLNLAGPRFGGGMLIGTDAKFMREELNINTNYTMIGYQFETRYVTTGEYQMLAEWILALNGLEKGMDGFSFSAAWLNGLRNNRSGFEVGAGLVYAIDANNGPSVRLITAVGKTIKSGQVNFPVNLFFIPSKKRGAVGITVGFNSKSIMK